MVTDMGERLLTVASFSTAPEAYLAKNRLDSADIYAMIVDEHTVGINWLYSNAVGGVKVKVFEKDLVQARAILEMNAPESESKSALSNGWGVCPVCGSENVEYYSDKRGPFLTWLTLGFPILPVRKKLRCLSCNHGWRYKP
jgi:hypothetical protein